MPSTSFPSLARFLLFCFGLFASTANAAVPPSEAQIAAYGERLLAEAVPDADGPAVAVLIARGDTVLFQGARGRASIELGVAATPETVFRIASVTKQFSAATLLALVDDGRAALDDPLSKYLPDFPNAANITLAQLLNHTSGVRSYTDIPGYMDTRIRADLDTAGLIAVFRDEPVDFKPGERWAYNNSGYILVGAVIEKIAGKPWHVVLQERVLAPLDMAHTGIDDGRAVIPGLADGYTESRDGVTRASPLSMSQPHAAGALRSTVGDLWRWNRALHGGRVLKPETYRRMITPEGAAAGDHYGYGITTGTLRGRKTLNHNGGIHGFVSVLTYLPESELSLVLLRNSDGAAPPPVERRLAAFALGDPYPEAVAVTLPPQALQAVEGVYRLDAQTTRTLRVKNGKLTSQRSGGPVYPLIPLGVDRFMFENSLTYIDIERDAAGAITGLRFFPEGEAGEAWPRTDEKPAERTVLELTAAQKQRLVGEYAGPQLTFKVFIDDAGALQLQVPGQPAFALQAESPDHAFVAEVDAMLVFSTGDAPALQVELEQGPTRMTLKRVP